MSEWYERACRALSRRWGPTREEREETREKKRDEYVKRNKTLRRAEGALREIKIVKSEDSKEYRAAAKKLKKAKRSFEMSEKAYRHRQFKKTMYFVDMDLEYEEVFFFSIFMSLLSLFAVISVFAAVHYLYHAFDLFELLLYAVPTILIVPTTVLMIISSYPDLLEKRLKAETIGRAPESINYMTMSMRVRPSLYRAVSFSAKHTEEPMASGLNKVLWDVYTRNKSSLEESFIDFALQWGDWNEDLKRSLYAIRSAMLEKTRTGLNSALEKANDIIIRGTKRQVEDFSNSLGTPTTILFAIGIMLPLIIGAMLPMLALGGLNVGAMETESNVSEGGIGTIHMVILMNVAAPGGALIYSYKILGDRPGTTSLPEIPDNTDVKKTLFNAIIIGILLVIPLFLIPTHIKFLMPLPLFWPPVAAVTYYCLARTLKVKEERRMINTMEREFPDALFQLGSRIAEGISLELAFNRTGKSMGGTEIGELFKKITCALQVDRRTLEDTLFGDDGILTNLPSRTIKATMKTVVEVSKKDPHEAGKTIIQISNFLRDMAEMDHDIKSKLSQSVEMMKGTAMIFAPVVMGVVVSLYFMLYDIFSEITTMEMISPYAFTTIVGIYLILMCGVITYFSTGIRSRMDPVEFKNDLGTILPICMVVFSLAVILGRIGMIG